MGCVYICEASTVAYFAMLGFCTGMMMTINILNGAEQIKADQVLQCLLGERRIFFLQKMTRTKQTK